MPSIRPPKQTAWFAGLGLCLIGLGASARTLVILDHDRPGALDTGFEAGLLADPVQHIILMRDGRIVLNQWRDVFRLRPDGTRDPDFSPADFPRNGLWGLDVQADGKVLLGSLSHVPDGALGAKAITRLWPDGSLDVSFHADTDGEVLALARQANGRIVVGGRFTSLNGIRCHRIGRLNADGSLDSAFDVGSGPGDCDLYSSGQECVVTALALQADGWILVGGNFGSFNGVARAALVRLRGDFVPAFTGLDLVTNTVVLTLASERDQTYVLEASTNLTHWIPVLTNTAAADRLQFFDRDAPHAARRFYRAKQLDP